MRGRHRSLHPPGEGKKKIGGIAISEHSFAVSRFDPPEVCIRLALLVKEGRRESRAPIAPAVVHKVHE
jgi:hypothetical protein